MTSLNNEEGQNPNERDTLWIGTLLWITGNNTNSESF